MNFSKYTLLFWQRIRFEKKIGIACTVNKLQEQKQGKQLHVGSKWHNSICNTAKAI